MHLSYSRINKRLTCPRQDWLHYHERWRPRQESATLKFGSALHKALSEHYAMGENPRGVFVSEWARCKEEDLRYGARDTWETLRDSGLALIDLFMEEHDPRIVTVYAVEHKFEVPVTDALTLVGYIDLVADVVNEDGEMVPTIIDWKTASRSYDPVQVSLSDQLTIYTLGSVTVKGVTPEQVAFCTLIKTKTPKIEWHFAKRTDADVQEVVAKAKWAYDQILAGVNHKNPGMHCSFCDFAPICMGDAKAIEENLIQLEEVAV